MPDSFSFSISRVFWAVVWLGCLAAMAPSWFGLLGDKHWTLDLMSHFRWQYLAAAVLILLLAVSRRTWTMAALGLATIGLNVWLTLSFPREAGEPDPEDPGLKVMCLNLFKGNEETQLVLDEVARVSPDVVVFVEVSSAWDAAMEILKTDYPHFLVDPGGVQGVNVYSRIPLVDARVKLLGRAEFPTLELEVTHQGKSIFIVGAHPLPPMSSNAHLMWVDFMETLGQGLSDRGVPSLVMGDLNATPWCQGMDELLKSCDLGFRLSDSGAPWFIAYPTWAVGSPMSIHIDHILCTPELVLSDYEVGRDVGSDHRAVIARVRWVK